MSIIDVIEELWEACPNGGDCDCVWARAAREIERLRKGGCARDQRTTQYCAEALTIQKNLDIVTGELGTAHIAIETLHSQRDEARREVCEVVASRYEISPEAEAKIRGWDCFKENKGA